MGENLGIRVIEPFVDNDKLDAYELIWLFALASLLGFFTETIWCYFKYGMIASRKGVIYGPFTPLYGFGAIILIVALYSQRNRDVSYVFFTTAILGSAFEYVASLFQETVFGSISWDYESKYISLSGRTSLIYGIFWGILGVLLMNAIYPLFCRCIYKLNKSIVRGVALTIVIFFSFNLFISSAAVYRQSQRINGRGATNAFERFLDQKYPDVYLQKIYPNMKFVK